MSEYLAPFSEIVRSIRRLADGAIVGLQDKDGNKYRFLTNSETGVQLADVIATGDGYLNVSQAIGPKSATVAALPSGSPSPFKAGTLAYASDGRKSGEAEGAGTGCPVWWDGTHWRTHYDNSIVAA